MLIFLFALGIVDIIFSNQVGLGPIILFFLAVKTQADLAANKFLREGLKIPVKASAAEPPPEEGFHFEAPKWGKEDIPGWTSYEQQPPKEKIHALPRSESKKESGQPKEAKPASQKVFTSPKAREDKPMTPKQSSRGEFKLPKFLGKPHEVLGIRENAATMTIVSAFRHWIKKHHPDKVGPASAMANDHAIKLNSAKETLLEQRKRLKKPA